MLQGTTYTFSSEDFHLDRTLWNHQPSRTYPNKAVAETTKMKRLNSLFCNIPMGLVLFCFFILVAVIWPGHPGYRRLSGKRRGPLHRIVNANTEKKLSSPRVSCCGHFWPSESSNLTKQSPHLPRGHSGSIWLILVDSYAGKAKPNGLW